MTEKEVVEGPSQQETLLMTEDLEKLDDEFISSLFEMEWDMEDDGENNMISCHENSAPCNFLIDSSEGLQHQMSSDLVYTSSSGPFEDFSNDSQVMLQLQRLTESMRRSEASREQIRFAREAMATRQSLLSQTLANASMRQELRFDSHQMTSNMPDCLNFIIGQSKHRFQTITTSSCYGRVMYY